MKIAPVTAVFMLEDDRENFIEMLLNGELELDSQYLHTHRPIVWDSWLPRIQTYTVFTDGMFTVELI
jgi:hypothetical protein